MMLWSCSQDTSTLKSASSDARRSGPMRSLRCRGPPASEPPPLARVLRGSLPEGQSPLPSDPSCELEPELEPEELPEVPPEEVFKEEEEEECDKPVAV